LKPNLTSEIGFSPTEFSFKFLFHYRQFRF